MSLRWRILTAFISIILLTVLLTLSVGFWTTQRNLQQFTVEIGQAEASDLSNILSQEYTATGGWVNVEPILFEFGYSAPIDVIATDPNLDPNIIVGEDGVINAVEGEVPLEFYQDIILDPFGRVVIVDTDNKILIDSFLELEPGTEAPLLPGEISPIFDLSSNQQVGFAIVEVNSEFLQPESSAILFDIVFTSLIGGLITAVIALILAVWFSNRITSPITALTNATKAIAKQEEPDLLPVKSSDELGQMSKAFNEMSLAMRTQRDLRKRLINDVSHEISTPLSVIQLEAKGLKDGLQTSEEASNQIIQEVDFLRNLVHDLNWLAETDSGELRLNLEPTDLSEVLEAEVGRWQNQVSAKDISLVLHPLPELPELNLDAIRLSQVLGNLLRNGIQHTPAKGSIEVSAEPVYRSGQSEQAVLVKVVDTGAGIEAADLPHLFERFYRADESRNRVSGGSGLGLAIAKAIVEAHGGTISISSPGAGKGTTVQFELPIDAN